VGATNPWSIQLKPATSVSAQTKHQCSDVSRIRSCMLMFYASVAVDLMRKVIRK
jgi:hypothetical protein